jgi:hypothetical protein
MKMQRIVRESNFEMWLLVVRRVESAPTIVLVLAKYGCDNGTVHPCFNGVRKDLLTRYRNVPALRIVQKLLKLKISNLNTLAVRSV